ncbi:hypothetical protein [Nannocystis radixulma]|uniref:Uncharacterized protein n=1 Tax=Nannocystis radixulma TaxID=2995305 RepID=A0ABT5BET6_9BACT|nr:hypothetical protein [Nannocystis radixulma]MDC0672228.1 hypothetical protein [Nannocystis radixulma]
MALDLETGTRLDPVIVQEADGGWRQGMVLGAKHHSKEIVLVKPPRPQPWGIIATRRFWASAVWSPLIIPYSLGMLLIVDLASLFVGPSLRQLPSWQPFAPARHRPDPHPRTPVFWHWTRREYCGLEFLKRTQ